MGISHASYFRCSVSSQSCPAKPFRYKSQTHYMPHIVYVRQFYMKRLQKSAGSRWRKIAWIHWIHTMLVPDYPDTLSGLSCLTPCSMDYLAAVCRTAMRWAASMDGLLVQELLVTQWHLRLPTSTEQHQLSALKNCKFLVFCSFCYHSVMSKLYVRWSASLASNLSIFFETIFESSKWAHWSSTVRKRDNKWMAFADPNRAVNQLYFTCSISVYSACSVC